MPMLKKIPITEVGRIYRCKKQHDVPLCNVCVSHEYIVVQKFGSLYGIHTWMTAKAGAVCHHSWSNRQNDPPCLSAYDPTDHMVTYNVNVNVLQGAILYGNYRLAKPGRKDVIDLPADPGFIGGNLNDIIYERARRPARRVVLQRAPIVGEE